MATNGYQVVGSDGQPLTVDMATLTSWARQGVLQPNTQIYDPNTRKWIPADTIRPLASIFEITSATFESVSLDGDLAESAQGSISGPESPNGPRPYTVSTESSATHGRPPTDEFTDFSRHDPSDSAINPRVAVLVSGIVVGLLFIAAISRTVIHIPTGTQTISSSDHRVFLSVPVVWTRFRSATADNTEFLEPHRDRGISMWKSAESYVDPVQLPGVAADVERHVFGRLGISNPIGPVGSLMVNRYPACRFQFDRRGQRGTDRIRYTLVDTPNGIYTISDFQRDADASASRPQMDQIIATFRMPSTAGTLP